MSTTEKVLLRGDILLHCMMRVDLCMSLNITNSNYCMLVRIFCVNGRAPYVLYNDILNSVPKMYYR